MMLVTRTYRHLFAIGFFAVLWTFYGCSPTSDQIEPVGYVRADGDRHVRFVFDKSNYNRVTTDDSPIWIEIDQVNIKTVSVVGDMNNWHKTSLTMTEEPNGSFELLFPVDQLSPDSSYAFKFLINDYYWVEPGGETPNRKETLFNHRQNKSFNFTLQL